MPAGAERVARIGDRPVAAELCGVSRVYDDPSAVAVTAVDGVSLAIEEGEFVVIQGRSGSGKTTLLNLMAGLTTPTSGTVRIAGTSLGELTDSERCRLRRTTLGLVFQFPSLMPALTVLENVVLPGVFGRAERAIDFEPRALELLELVGISDKADAFPRQLSAGQQQRVVLARALINQPRLILADEPTSNLDEQTEAEMMALFRSVHDTTGGTIVMVTHALALLSHGTRTLKMVSGRLADPAAPDA